MLSPIFQTCIKSRQRIAAFQAYPICDRSARERWDTLVLPRPCHSYRECMILLEARWPISHIDTRIAVPSQNFEKKMAGLSWFIALLINTNPGNFFTDFFVFIPSVSSGVDPANVISWSAQPQITLGRGAEPGLSTLTLGLPTLTAEQRAQFSQFDVEWRAVGDSTWQSTSTPASSSTVTLPQELAVGSYEIRVRAKSSDGSTTSQYTGLLTVTVRSRRKSALDITRNNVCYFLLDLSQWKGNVLLPILHMHWYAFAVLVFLFLVELKRTF